MMFSLPSLATNQLEVTRKGNETKAPVVSVRPSKILGALRSSRYQKRKDSIKPHNVPRTKMTMKRTQIENDFRRFKILPSIFFGGGATSMSRMDVVTRVRNTKKLKK